MIIPIELKKESHLVVNVFNIRGQLMETIHKGRLLKGVYNLEWNAKNMSSGLYLIQIKINNQVQYEKSILLK